MSLKSRRRHARGYGLVWLLVFSAACAIAATLFTAEEDTAVGRWIVVGSALVLLPGVVLELIRSAFDAAKLLAVLLLGVAGSTAAIASERSWWDGRAVGLVAGAVVVAAACLAWRRYIQTAPSPWPNYLRDRFGAEAVRELGGVQLVAQGGKVSVGAGEGFDVEVVAQNCWDAPRTLAVTLRLDGQYQPGREPLQLADGARLELPAGGAGKLTLHCLAAPRSVGEHPVRVRATVTGAGGRRLRKWRAPAYSDRVPLLLDLLALFSFSLGTEHHGVVLVHIDDAAAPSIAPAKVTGPGFSAESW